MDFGDVDLTSAERMVCVEDESEDSEVDDGQFV